MPLQIIPLDQSIYKKQQQPPRRISAVSEALTPQRGRTGGGTSRAESENTGFMANVRAGEASRKKAYEEEMQRKRDYYEEVGRKSSAIYEEGQKRYQEHLAREREKKAAGAAPTAAPLTKENMPETAMEVWKFISTLEPESQKFYIQRLKQKEEPTGYIEAAGERVEVPGSVGMYRYLVDKGLLDPTTDTIIEKEREFEKGTFEIVEEGGKVYQLNTATGERKPLGTVDKPEDVVNAINKQANADALAQYKADPSKDFSDYKYDALIDYGVDPEIAADMAKIKEIPKDPSKSNWFKDIYKKAVDWIKGKGAKPTTKEDWEKAAGKSETFNEANVTSLVPVISDDVTTAERAHYKSEGATDSDIDEAIRRKVSK